MANINRQLYNFTIYTIITIIYNTQLLQNYIHIGNKILFHIVIKRKVHNGKLHTDGIEDINMAFILTNGGWQYISLKDSLCNHYRMQPLLK